jgi:cytochrome c
MSRSADRLRAWALIASLPAGFAMAQAPAADAPKYGIGRPATPQQIAAWDIDIRPDGHGVKKGRGTVEQGQEI